jgi:hypothetical protein
LRRSARPDFVGTEAGAGRGMTEPVEPMKYREFALRERESALPSDQTETLRQMLRQSYPLLSDTYITEALPVLLARLSLPPADTQ